MPAVCSLVALDPDGTRLGFLGDWLPVATVIEDAPPDMKRAKLWKSPPLLVVAVVAFATDESCVETVSSSSSSSLSSSPSSSSPSLSPLTRFWGVSLRADKDRADCSVVFVPRGLIRSAFS